MNEYKTGQKAPETGNYDWVRYTDGTKQPRPKPEEMQIPLDKDDTFPPVKSSGKAAWWRGPV